MYRSLMKADIFFPSYFTNKVYFYNCLGGNSRASPMLFGVIFFSGRQTSICETTGLTCSNLYQIYSRYFLWYLFLLHIPILTLDFPRWLWWIWSSSRETLVCDGIFSIDSNYQRIFISLCRNLMAGW